MLLSLATSMLNSACMVVGVRTVEQTDYKVLHAADGMELRLYEPYLVARTYVEGELKQASNEGFRRLAGYIFGKNGGQRSIAMTAPVTTTRSEGEKISMTAPVVQEKQGGRWLMEFMMPGIYRREGLPEPLDSRVSIVEVPGRLVAAVRFSGAASEEDFDARTARLEEWIAGQGLKQRSTPRFARYDPPFTIPFLRRNEVHITVEGEIPASGGPAAL
jgi:hypothetical protein